MRRKRPCFFLRLPLVGITLRQVLLTSQMDVSDAAPALVICSWLHFFPSISVSDFLFTVSLVIFSHYLLDFSFIQCEVLLLYKYDLFFIFRRVAFYLPTSSAGLRE